MVSAEPGGQPVALVSGSRGGIGRHIVDALAGQGMLVVGLDRDGDEALGEIRGDVSVTADCDAAVAEVVRRHGRLDVVVAAAGINLRQAFESLDMDKARALFDVNVWGTAALLRAAYPPLSKSPQAAAVVLTSISGELGFRNSSVYAMSKMALTALVRCLAVEWSSYPIRVNAVAPAMVETAMNAEVRQIEGYLENKRAGIPLGRTIRATEVAAAVAFLAGPGGSGITGEVLHVDGGSVIAGR